MNPTQIIHELSHIDLSDELERDLLKKIIPLPSINYQMYEYKCRDWTSLIVASK
jgi:hypothetical protein